MKKFVVLSLFGLLIMAFSVTVYAQKLEFKASGFIDAQSLWYENVPVSGATSSTKFLSKPIFGVVDSDYLPGSTVATRKSFNRPIAYWESRARLKFDAIMDPSLSGTIFLEMDSTRWGDRPGGHLGVISERNTYGFWSSGDRAAVEIKNIYIDVGLPYFGIPIPMSARIGLQPMFLRPNMLMGNDGMGIIGALKVDPVTISPIYGKPLEGVDQVADDADVYGLHVNAKIATFTIGGYGLYYNMNTYPLLASTVDYVSLSGANIANLIFGTMRAETYWLGVYADGKAGPANLNFDFIYDKGKVKNRINKNNAIVPDVKYTGWSGRIKVDFPWEKFNFGVVGMYASGADMKKTSVSGLPGTLVAYTSPSAPTTVLSTKVKSYVTPPGSEQYAIFNEGLVFYPSVVDRSDHGFYTPNAFSLCRGATGGTWMAKFYGSIKATPFWKVTLQGMYIGDTTKNGNTIGTAVNYAGFPKDDKTIGWEFGLINELNIYKNLKWTAGLGYLIAGDALDYRVLGTAATTYINKGPSNPWALITNLTYSF